MEAKNFEQEFIKDSSVYQTKLRILKAAAQEFAKKGYSGTTIRNIAVRAEVPHSSITYHFGNKDALFETVIGNLFKETFEISNSFNIDPKSKNMKAAFIDHLTKVAHFYYENPAFLTIIHRESMDVDEPLKIISEDLQRLKVMVTKHLIIGQEAGLFKAIPIASLQMLFSGAFQSLFVNQEAQLFKIKEAEAHRLIEKHVEAVVELMVG